MSEQIPLETDLLTLSVDETGVATARLDDPEASVNKISWKTLEAFSEALNAVEDHSAPTALVFISGKPESFIVGADLKMLRAFEMPAEARKLSQTAHDLIRRVRGFDLPTVAAIHGPAMGGGLEMTLPCDYRIASTADATKMALPEVKLGLLPGGGGTQLFPRLVGVQQALPPLLTGKNIYPDKAHQIGLVDALIHPPGLHSAARRAARQLSRGELSIDRDEQSWGEQILESNPLSRRLIYRQADKRTTSRTHGNYPAPPRIIDAVRTGMEEGLEAGLDVESRHFGDLVFTPESQSLVRLFFAKNDAETNPHQDLARAVDTVGVLGAGLMGSGITEVTVENGPSVVLKDQTLELAAQGKKEVWKTLSRKVDKGIINRFRRDQITERVVPTAEYAPLRTADLVIEAVPEDLVLKQQVFREVEQHVSSEAVLATNTSALPVSRIAESTTHPERVLGMHYFSPVSDIPLLEIIQTDQTSEEALATAYNLGLTQDKTVIVVNDGPGFYTTRILALYMNEALLLFEHGADISQVDRFMERAGFPMGPFELFDLVGLDVAAKITEIMGEALSSDRVPISETSALLADDNLLGQKTGEGFYNYTSADDEKSPEPDEVNEGVYSYVEASGRTTPSEDVVQERLLLTMVNEAIRCFEDDVLRSPTDGDLGAVFGLGFPPFLGGPFHYVDREGPETITDRLQRLADRFGSRFQPAEMLSAYASSGRTFHSD